MKYYELTKEEKQILSDFDKGYLEPIVNPRGKIKRHRQYARYTLNKTRNINLRLSERDYQKLKAKAVTQVRYQTLAASVLHQYSNN